ncbi:MAG: protein tyrosine phosphatase [Planctomycetales bacterium 71-10]|nr:MAG: protein tyrosine phosphatase [Planctomycetales bacterium 71-10]
MRRILLGAIFAAGAAVAGWMAVLDRQNRLRWDHWDVVKPGVLYRSGQLNGDQLTEAVRRYGIKTVVNFQLPGREMQEERALAKSLNVGFVNLPMPGDGFGREEQFRKVLELVDDDARRPVLVHCARGTCRTGSSVAMYRFERDGWTIDDVAAEARRQTYREGWIPGYIYAMARNKPDSDLHHPITLDERNAPAEAESLPLPEEAADEPR